jgi:hypothetical protein
MQPVWLSLQIGRAVPTGAAQVCGVVGVMHVGAPASELPVVLLPLPVAPVLAPDVDPPDDVPVAAPEGAPLFVPADEPDAPPEDVPVEPPVETPEEPPLVSPDPVEPLVAFVVPVPADEPGLWEHATTNDAAARKPHDSQVLLGLISKLSQASLRDGARASLLARARPRIR